MTAGQNAQRHNKGVNVSDNRRQWSLTDRLLPLDSQRHCPKGPALAESTQPSVHGLPGMGLVWRKHLIKDTRTSTLEEEVKSFLFQNFTQNHMIHKNEMAKEVTLTEYSFLFLTLRCASCISSGNFTIVGFSFLIRKTSMMMPW